MTEVDRELPAPRSFHLSLQTSPSGLAKPPVGVRFMDLVSGAVPAIYLPEGARERRGVTSALRAMSSRHPLEGIASPDVWEDLLAATGLAANVYVVDRGNERWRVLEVLFDPGAETGQLRLRHLGRRARLGDLLIDLQDAFGYMVPVVIYKGVRRNPPELPTIEIKKVFHVGAEPFVVIPGKQAKPHSSFEGFGLSVSVHPEAWRQIARLGNSPTWTMKRKDGQPGQFLDVHGVAGADLTEQAVSQGLLKETKVWRSVWEDEDGEENWFELDSKEKAMVEAENMEGRVEEAEVYAPTKKLKKEWGKFYRGNLSTIMAEQIAWQVLLDGSGLDGFWWRDNLDPYRLSAPRGMIFYSKLREWISRSHGKNPPNDWERFLAWIPAAVMARINAMSPEDRKLELNRLYWIWVQERHEPGSDQGVLFNPFPFPQKGGGLDSSHCVVYVGWDGSADLPAKILYCGSYNECFEFLHKHQGQSVDWAMKHGGYSIEPAPWGNNPRIDPASFGNTDGRYKFVTDCTGSTYEDMREMLDEQAHDDISMKTFAQKIGLGQWRELRTRLGYDRYFPITRDWHVTYHKGWYRGSPAVWLRHSGIERIFTLDGKLGPSQARGGVRENP